MQHPQVVHSPSSNDSLQVYIDGHSEPQMVPKLLLKLSVQELHHIMVNLPEYVELKEAIYADNNSTDINSSDPT